MKFSTQQLLLIILSAMLLTMAVLRFLFLRAGFDIGASVVLVVVALCGIYGAYKLDHTVRTPN
jgi:hypothetical protein